MQNGLKILQCCAWFAPWYAKNTSCLERLCDAKILNCDKSKNILRNGQKFHVGIVIVREGQGREGWPIFRWSDAISSLLVISNTFALPPSSSDNLWNIFCNKPIMLQHSKSLWWILFNWMGYSFTMYGCTNKPSPKSSFQTSPIQG